MGLEAVDRMAAVLAALSNPASDAPAGAGASLNDVCERTGLSRSTASRFLAALIEHGYVYRSDEVRFSLGAASAELALVPLSHSRLSEVAEPHMRRLANAVNEAVCISVLDGLETQTIHQVGVSQPVLAENWIDRRWPIRLSGSAVSIMATWSPSAATALITRLPRNERSAVSDAVATTRQDLVSWSEGDYVKALTSVAAPIVDQRGHATSALIIYGPSYRFPKEQGRDKVEKMLTVVAAAISEDIY